MKIIEISPPKESRFSPTFFDPIQDLQQETEFFSVPSNPMGNIHMANEEVCREITLFSKRPTILHLPAKGRDLLQHQSHLLGIHKIGIRHLFIVRGDRSRIFPDSSYRSPILDSIDLVKLIKEKFNKGLNSLNESIGEPTSFSVGCALNLTPHNLETGRSQPEPKFQMERLKLKIQAGADYLITQPIFDVEKAGSFLHQYEQLYGPIPVPIIPGILPVSNTRQLGYLSEIPGIAIPATIQQKLCHLNVENDFKETSLKITSGIIQQLRSIHPMVKGIYFSSPGSSYDLVIDLLQNCF